MKNVAIIQARMGSTRLPGKVLREINGMTMLDRVVRRVMRCRFIDEVVVATSDLPMDLAIVNHCRDYGYSVFTGDHLDVLNRFVKAANKFEADRIVRITADCPLIDNQIIDQIVIQLENDPLLDYACNFFPNRMYPRGLDAEAFTLATLEMADKLSRDPAQREHVTLQIYQNPSLYRIGSVQPKQNHSHLRWTVDTAEDLQLVNLIYKHFGHQRFNWHQVLEAYNSNPHWLSINAETVQKKVA